ncbi:imidazolonepropionase [Escherichia marmotae]|uniref:imidazolonepropionase n=1 Tax=Escherichia TaxID=561 RepID=UPI000CF7787E|nr:MULTISPECIES: imidazolonepropionase [Escherichia]EFN9755409.1 imidazolonepropionase [Escherichia coli]EFO1629628.1 imidazolonepropionase [Escherichia coli]MBB2416896.1 imidazolonepropionase [Escherichia sp. 11.1596]MBB2421243.1 imidazolonepropionase [Escherichia sp. 12.2610]MBB2425679.1 imidazolonepropionase [Escherichia sp. 11.1597]
MSALTLWRNTTLATLSANDWGVIENGALISRGDTIVWLGKATQIPRELTADITEEHDLQGKLLTPGLVDCHTHLVYGGQRANEFEMRLQGVAYEDIARAGGGILSTVNATRAASETQLFELAAQRLQNWLREGVSTLEIKSGYGLTLEDETRCLRVIRRLQESTGLRIQSTFLGAHSLPPEFAGRSDDYITALCDWMGVLHGQGLIDAVDAFCENIAFSPDQVRRVFSKAQHYGVPVKLHAEQLSDQQGAALAAAFSALSCDHLEYLSESGIVAMKAAGTVAVLLPGAYYFLRETHLPPIAALRAAGVPIAISTDHNPGTSPNMSLPLMINMACTLFRMTPLEAVQGVTRNAAKALGLIDRGELAPGLRADMAVWDLNHPRELAYWFGHQPCQGLIVGGKRSW